MTAPAFAMVPLAALRDRRLGLRDLRVLGVLYGYPFAPQGASAAVAPQDFDDDIPF